MVLAIKFGWPEIISSPSEPDKSTLIIPDGPINRIQELNELHCNWQNLHYVDIPVDVMINKNCVHDLIYVGQCYKATTIFKKKMLKAANGNIIWM